MDGYLLLKAFLHSLNLASWYNLPLEPTFTFSTPPAMIRRTRDSSSLPASPAEQVPDSKHSPAEAATSPSTSAQAYGMLFWFAYISNTLMMVAVSLLFRYSDFVSILGGSEQDLGLIVGVGMIGSLLMRLSQGKAIDRYGARAVWTTSMVLVTVTLGLHIFIEYVNGPGIYALQIIYRASLSGVFGASITYVSLRSPVERMAEVIGVLGSSGFIGIALGTQLGDFLCRDANLTRGHIDLLFIVASGLAFASLTFAWLATKGVVKPSHRPHPPMAHLILRYHPGTMLLMSLAMGMAVALPFTYLRPFTAELGMKTIGTFFACYTVTAFVTRVLLRRLPEKIGVRNTVLAGMTTMIISVLLYLPVHQPWQLAFPGMLAGAAHALLFPAIVAGGGSAFPTRYRGLGVTLTLGMFDLGGLIGAPLAGVLVEGARLLNWPAYPSMFITFAGLLAGMTIVFAVTYQARPAGVRRPKKRSKKGASPWISHSTKNDNSRSNGASLPQNRPAARNPGTVERV